MSRAPMSRDARAWQVPQSLPMLSPPLHNRLLVLLPRPPGLPRRSVDAPARPSPVPSHQRSSADGSQPAGRWARPSLLTPTGRGAGRVEAQGASGSLLVTNGGPRTWPSAIGAPRRTARWSLADNRDGPPEGSVEDPDREGADPIQPHVSACGSQPPLGRWARPRVLTPAGSGTVWAAAQGAKGSSSVTKGAPRTWPTVMGVRARSASRSSGDHRRTACSITPA